MEIFLAIAGFAIVTLTVITLVIAKREGAEHDNLNGFLAMCGILAILASPLIIPLILLGGVIR